MQDNFLRLMVVACIGVSICLINCFLVDVLSGQLDNKRCLTDLLELLVVK